MDLVWFVASLALAEYYLFAILTGQSRGRHGVAAPAMTGHPDFERWFRVQGNTVEQIVVFLPALFGFAIWVSEPVAAGLGVVFIVGRALYARAYVVDPARRGPGFLLTMLANVVLVLGAAIGALVSVLG